MRVEQVYIAAYNKPGQVEVKIELRGSKEPVSVAMEKIHKFLVESKMHMI